MFPKLSDNYVVRKKYQKIYLLSQKASPPPPGSEVYVGNLCSVISDDELVFIFSQVGPLYRLQRMINNYDSKKHFAFISYHNEEDANKAALYLHKFSIRRDVKINVFMSMNNCQLYFGNIPRKMTREDIMLKLTHFINGIVKVLVFPTAFNPSINRGYAFVEFMSHSLAAIVKRDLGKELFWDGRQIVVEWVYQEPFVPPFIFLQIKILMFRNVPIECSQSVFRKFIYNRLHTATIQRIYKKHSYAFVHFQSREAAEIAIKKLRSEDLRIYNREIKVEWARPPLYRQKRKVPNNFSKFSSPGVHKTGNKNKRKSDKKKPFNSSAENKPI
ncbi:APOBEC1 complementation factor-like [Tribolium madens]|uniref:APOBEC1 complementation factor-like n=1 Tax=Tribolium madens TaxID=41895 RepID=UPI001CF745B2|nr:APOBEC1 complementation factor-like [Tribolium madens]